MAEIICPYDQGATRILDKSEAAEVLLNVLVSPKSSVFKLIKSSIGRNATKGTIRECGTCGHISIFNR